MNDPLDVKRLRQVAWLARVEYQPSLGSTNDVARRMAAEIAKGETLLVVTEEQTSGRGRGTNRWWTGPGALAFSLLIDAASWGIERRQHGMMALAAAMAVVDAVSPRLSGQTIGLHWPNDVFVGDRKLAGVLVEGLADGRQIVGIGCNVNNRLAHAPSELAAIVTTLHDLTSTEHDRTAVLVDLLEQFAARLGQLARRPDELGRESNGRCLQHDRSLTIEAHRERVTGICAGIAEDGALLLDTAEGPRRFYSGVLVKQLPSY